jgi:predicted Zn-ribbon and HTH transcriptional regulator
MNNNDIIGIYLYSNPNITYQKGVYRRYCNFFSDTKKLISIDSSESDRKRSFIINTNDDSYRDSVLNDIFLEIEDIDKIEYVDIYMKKREDNDDIIMPNETHFYKLNKYLIQSLFNKVDLNLYKLNYVFNMFPLILMDLTKFNFHIDIHYTDIIPKNDTIYIEYKIIDDEEEKENFRTLHHEYLLKICRYIKFDLKEGYNKIELNEFSQKQLYGIVLNYTNKDMKVNGKMITENNNRIISIDRKFKSYIKCFENFGNTYIMDPHCNFLSHRENFQSNDSGYQPSGSIITGINPYLELYSNLDGSVYITVYEYDIFRVHNSHFKTIYFLHNTTEEIINRMNQRNEELAPPPLPPVENEPVIINDDNQIENFINNYIKPEINNDMNLYKDLLDQYEKDNVIEILKSDIEDDCVISMTEIEKDEYFYKCAQCKKPSKYQEFREWIKLNKKCPHCTKEIITFPKLYICKESFSNDLIETKIEYVYEEEDNTIENNKKKNNLLGKLISYFSPN